MMPIESITKNLVGSEQEKALWDAYYALGFNETLNECIVKVEDRAALEKLIRTAHVVVEKDDELLGLFRTQHDFLKDRYLWISMMTDASDHQYANQTCMGDEFSAEEFLYAQEM